MEIKNINKYIKTIENKNIIMVYHNNILNVVIKKNSGVIYTTPQNIKKSSIKNYINFEPEKQIEFIDNMDTINIDILEG